MSNRLTVSQILYNQASSVALRLPLLPFLFRLLSFMVKSHLESIQGTVESGLDDVKTHLETFKAPERAPNRQSYIGKQHIPHIVESKFREF